MNISPDKRNNLIKLGVAALLVLGALWFFLISPARASLGKKITTQTDLTKKISDKKKTIQRAAYVRVQLEDSGATLAAIEDQMVTGDSYRWIIRALRAFETTHQIEFSKYDPPQTIEPNLPLNLPYKTVSFVVNGTAAYHDLGKFLARFENAYPHIRIRRLEMEPAGIPAPDDEKLSFVLEVNVLAKTPHVSAGKALSQR